MMTKIKNIYTNSAGTTKLYCCTTDVVTRDLSSASEVRYPKARKKLLRLMADDQNERTSPGFYTQNRAALRALVQREQKRTSDMIAILSAIKTPSTRNIGLDGSRAVWLIALHNPDYKDAGRIVLRKMKYLFYRNKSQVFYPGIPYLVDRTMVYGGNLDHKAKQLYGTQRWVTTTPDGTSTSGSFPMIDPGNLTKRRNKFDLAGPDNHIPTCPHRES